MTVHGAIWERISGDTGDQAHRKSLIPEDARREATAAAAAASNRSGKVQMKGGWERGEVEVCGKREERARRNEEKMRNEQKERSVSILLMASSC